jgi:very-short-patch-repair endonuclease
VLSLDGSVLFGLSAAAVHRIDGFAFTRDIHVVATARFKARPGVVPHFSSGLTQADVAIVSGIPTTAPARTVADLAGLIGSNQLEEAFEDVLRRRLTTKARIQLELLRRPRNSSGVAHLRELLARSSDVVPTESGLETKVIQLLREAGYPNPVRQRVINSDGAFVGRVDLAWPERKLVLEVDSFRWHSGSEAWHKDIDRRNELVAAGLTVVHATSKSLSRPGHFLRSFGKVWRSLD